MLTQFLEPQYRLVCRCRGDVLDYMPAQFEGRDSIMTIINMLAEGIVKYQDPETGVWWQVTDQNNRKGNYLESSASSLFVYFLCKAVNKDIFLRNIRWLQNVVLMADQTIH